ncbi:MAG: hypothetical protein AB7O97_14135 [Planctomycetota bacterium]
MPIQKHLSVLLGLIATTTMIAAQERCPYQMAQRQPASWEGGPSITCDSGVQMQIASIQVTTGAVPGGMSCPLFAIITPDHDRVAVSASPTRVEPVGSAQQIVAFFNCRRSYFLFFSLGTTCELAETKVIAQLPLYRTVSCPFGDAVL